MAQHVRTMIALLGAAFFAAGCAPRPASGDAGASPGVVRSGAETTIILVRHAEKADVSADPSLSDAGRTRAARLSEALRDAGVDAVYYSDRKRTRETAELAFKDWTTKPEVIHEYPATTKPADLAKALRAEKAGRVILFVGHSNVIAGVLKSLGGWDHPELKETDFDHLFVVRLKENGGELIRAGYPPL